MGSKANQLASKIIEDLLNQEEGDEGAEEETSLRESQGDLGDIRDKLSKKPVSKNFFPPVESLLESSENLRKAQGRILDLEQNIRELKKENFNLLTVGRVFQNKAEGLSKKMDTLKGQYETAKEEFQKEKKTLYESLDEKKQEADESKQKIDVIEEMVSSRIQRIRYREQDLENRIEIMKKEADVVLRSKDKMILGLKREIRSIHRVLESYKEKGSELNLQLRNKEKVLKQSVKTLHFVLSLLEHSKD